VLESPIGGPAGLLEEKMLLDVSPASPSRPADVLVSTPLIMPPLVLASGPP